MKRFFKPKLSRGRGGIAMLMAVLALIAANYIQQQNFGGTSSGGSGDPPTTTNATWTSATALNTALTVSTTGPISGYGSVEVSAVTSGNLFGTQLVADVFPYANGDLHTANVNWTYQSGSYNVNANRAFSSAALSFTFRSDVTPGNDQYAEAVMVVGGNSGTQNGGPCVRMAAGAQTAYCIQTASNILRISRWLAGSQTTMFENDSVVPITGDLLRIQAKGTLISIFKNGTLIGSIVDPSIASGNVGFAFAGNSTTNGVSSFDAGNLVTTNPQLTFEVQDAQGTWFPIQGKRPNASNFYDLNYDLTNGSQTWQFTTNGFSNYRVRLSATLPQGSVTVTGQALNPLFTNATPIGTTCTQYVRAGQFLILNITPTLNHTGAFFQFNYYVQPLTGGPAILTANLLNNTGSNFTLSGGNNTAIPIVINTEGCLQKFSWVANTMVPYASPGDLNMIVLLQNNAGGPTGGAGIFEYSNMVQLAQCNAAQNYTCSWPESGSKGPQEVPGISVTYCASGCTGTLVTPGAGANFTFSPSISFQYRLKSVTFTVTTSNASSVRTVALQYTNNGGKIVWTQAVPSNQGASDTINYTFSQNASASCLGVNCSMWFPETVIDAGDTASSSGISGVTTIATVITGIQAADTVTNIVLNFEVKNGTD